MFRHEISALLNICNWFADNKLSTHFEEDKTKCILFGSMHKLEKVGKVNTTYRGIDIKQYSSVTYLGFIADNAISGELMAFKTLKKINSKFSFLCRNKEFVTPALRRLLRNALVQPRFDYLNQKLKKKLQTSKNKSICLPTANT